MPVYPGALRIADQLDIIGKRWPLLAIILATQCQEIRSYPVVYGKRPVKDVLRG
jgi:hypothetical protein